MPIIGSQTFANSCKILRDGVFYIGIYDKGGLKISGFCYRRICKAAIKSAETGKAAGKEKTGTKKKTDPGIELYGAGSDNSSDSGRQIDRRKEESS